MSFCTIVLKEILVPNKYVAARILFEPTIDNSSLIPMYFNFGSRMIIEYTIGRRCVPPVYIHTVIVLHHNEALPQIFT